MFIILKNIFIGGVLMVVVVSCFWNCAPMGEEGESISQTSSSTIGQDTTGGQGTAPLPPAPVVTPSPPSSSPPPSGSGSSTGVSATSFTIGQDLSLPCLPSGLSVQGHDYGNLSCDKNSSQAVIATVDISEKKVSATVSQSMLIIDKIKLIGAPAPEANYNNDEHLENRGSGLKWYWYTAGSAYMTMLPKAVLTLSSPSSPNIIDLGFLSYETETKNMGTGVTQQISSYIWTPAQLTSTSTLKEFLPEDLHNAKLEIFFGRHQCSYDYRTTLAGVIGTSKEAALNSCQRGEGNRIWNDKVFLLQLKTKNE